MTNVLRYLFFAALVFFGSVTAAWAQKSESYSIDSIVEFLQDTQVEILLDRVGTPLSESRSVALMNDVIESVANDDVERLTQATEKARTLQGVQEPDWPTALKLAQGVIDAMMLNAESSSNDPLLQFLDDFDAQGNWYIQSLVHSTSGYIYITQGELLVAARYIDDAMQLIPTELSERVTNARYRTSDVSMVLHAMQGSPAFLLEAAKVQKAVKAEIGEQLNRYELMTNFVFTLNRVRDFEGAAQVAELLLNEKRPAGSLPGLAEGYMAETFIELHDYDRARQLSELSLSLSDYPVVVKRAKYTLIVALAGLGLDAQAHAIMDEENWEYNHDTILTSVNKQAILHAEALLAMHKSDSKFAVSLMKRRTDLLVQRVQRANSSGMTSLLSNLENTRERQSERQIAIQREAEMKAVQLEQKTNLNRLLWALIGVLTIAFNLLLVFLRYRIKLSSKVQGLQKDALSAEKMKTEFLGVINHELRTPLNGIIGISDAMIHHAQDPMMQAQAVAVQESGQVLFDLLDSLITMSTIEGNRLTLESEKTNLSKIIDLEAAEWVDSANRKDLDYTYHIAPELQQAVIADNKRLRQCIHFLLSNAVRFTHHGRIHLHATAETAANGALAVKIIVADTGQGMSEEVQSRLFKPFLQADAMMTRKYGGAGLSLAIGRKLAQMMGGDLTVTSRIDRGSEFVLTVELPLATPAQSQQTNTDTPSVNPERITEQTDLISPTIDDNHAKPDTIVDLMLGEQLFTNPAKTDKALSVAIVETDAERIKTLRTSLKDLGCKCVETRSSQQTLKLIDDKHPDVIIVNQQVPDIDVLSMLTRIRQRSDTGEAILIIVLTTDESPAEKAKFFSSGADILLDLPIQPDQLADALSQARSLRAAA